MINIQVPTREQVAPAVQSVFDQLQEAFGMMPNLYATIGYSENALAAYLAFQQAQTRGSFNAQQREAVFLAVSQVNDCQYCQAAHTVLGKLYGFSEAETVQLRAGTYPGHRLNIISRLAADIARRQGRPVPQLLADFFALGYGDKELIDLVALVADITLANYVRNLTQIPIDFPAVSALEARTPA